MKDNPFLSLFVAWRSYDETSRELDHQKDALLDEIGRRLEQRTDKDSLFIIHWTIK